MLLAGADDAAGPNATVVLFPAWPCEWDVSFKLRATGNTTIEATLVGGKLTKLDVAPATRRGNVKVLPCASLFSS